MTTLNEFTKCKLMELIRNLSKNPRIFYREAQFQFELAWEIQKAFKEDSGIQVYLESLKNVVQEEDDTKKKRYTDIVVQDQNGNYVAIELKYKTKQGTDTYEELKTHAAQDLGRYDFLWDTCRNEQLIQNGNTRWGTCVKGFSILLTNDSGYWKKTGKDRIYENFSLITGRTMPTNENLDWKPRPQKTEKDLIKSVGKARMDQKINLKGNYLCEWHPYDKNDNPNHFEFLIFESFKQ